MIKESAAVKVAGIGDDFLDAVIPAIVGVGADGQVIGRGDADEAIPGIIAVFEPLILREVAVVVVGDGCARSGEVGGIEQIVADVVDIVVGVVVVADFDGAELGRFAAEGEASVGDGGIGGVDFQRAADPDLDRCA